VNSEFTTGMDDSDKKYCDKVFAFYEREQFPSAKKLDIETNEVTRFKGSEVPMLRI
jgi:hypothetical protein